MIDLTPILGTYTPLVDGTGTIIGGLTGVDYPYLIKAVILLMGLKFIFIVLGELVKCIHK